MKFTKHLLSLLVCNLKNEHRSGEKLLCLAFDKRSQIKNRKLVTDELNNGRSLGGGVESLTSQLNVLDKYHQLVKAKVLTYDAHQFEVVLQLNYFHSKLVDYRAEKLVDESGSILTGMFRKYFKSSSQQEDENLAQKPKPRVKSIYLYGGVGNHDFY